MDPNIIPKGKAVLKGAKDTFRPNNLEQLVMEAVQQDPKLQEFVQKDPQNMQLLMRRAEAIQRKYKGPIYWGNVVDNWDRILAVAKLAGEVGIPGAGTLAKWGSGPLEYVPKGLYAAYYTFKTGDLMALPYWITAEALSEIPYVGELIDWAKIYRNRAQKKFGKALKRSLRKGEGGEMMWPMLSKQPALVAA